MRLLRRILCWTLSLTILLNGCSTLHLPDYEAQPINNYSNFQVKDGLTVAIHPLTGKEEVLKYFGTDLLSSNILPVFVIAENRSSSSSFILSKERSTMKAGQLEVDFGTDSSKAASESGGETVQMVGVLLISLPLLFVGAKMISNATVIKHNFVVNELQMKTLSPGKVTHGFVYFQLPEERLVLDQWVIHLEALDLRSKDIKYFDIEFEWERR